MCTRGWGGGGVGVESSTKFINMGLKVKDFILWRFTEKSTIFRRGGGGEVHEKPIYRRGLPKKGAWTVCRFKRGVRG